MEENTEWQQLVDRVAAIEQEIKEIRLILEKETNRIIRAIAEGQYRALQSTESFAGEKQSENPKDILLKRLNELEMEIVTLKERTQRSF